MTVGNNCVLGARCILKDYVQVEDNTNVPPDMVIPPFAIVAGNPCKIIGEAPASLSTTAAVDAMNIYKSYQKVKKK